MQDYILERTIQEAEYIINKNATVRDCAKHFNISKSTVHSDIKNRLSLLNISLYNDVNKILQNNFLERHIRGGISTKKKYLDVNK